VNLINLKNKIMTTKQLFKAIKVSLFSAVLVLVVNTVKAQHGDEPAFDKGSKTLGLSLGVGDGEGSYNSDYGYDNNNIGLPAFAVTYDQGIVGDVGPGTIGVGGIVAGKTSWDNVNGYRATWSSFEVALRGDWHLTILKDRNNKFDPYAGVAIGGRFNHFSDNAGDPSSSSSSFIFAPFVGAKYNFAEHVGVFAEASVDISLLRGGICFNF
jgi:hypothetical protein